MAQDAARWRALVGSGYVRVLGSAKLGTPAAHIGVEFTACEVPDADPAATAHSVAWLTEYADGLATPTPTPAVADALARAEEGGRLAEAATRGPWEQRQRAVIGPAIMGGGEMVCRTSEWRHETSQADAEFIAWARNNVPLMREDVRALAGQLARAEGRDEYAIALQRLCEWAAAMMRGESREMPAGSLDASPHHAWLLADAASTPAAEVAP